MSNYFCTSITSHILLFWFSKFKQLVSTVQDLGINSFSKFKRPVSIVQRDLGIKMCLETKFLLIYILDG